MTTIPAVTDADELPERVDVLVVGGGPAGAVAAALAARLGLRTLLVDRTAHPRDKVCGCCLSPFGQRALHEAGLSEALEGSREVRRVRLVCGARSALVRRAGTRVLSRAHLDGALLRAAARSGATLGWPFVAEVRPLGDTRLRGPGGARTVHARVRVVADGLRGASLADRPRFAWSVRAGGRFGVGAILPAEALELEDDEIRMHVDASGYAGAVRLPDGRVDVAAALGTESVRAAGGVSACLETLLGAAVRDRTALRAADWQGAPQLWRRRRVLHDEDTLVTGDAAGYVEPFTGEGMGWAIATGAAAAEHAAAVLHGDRPMDAWDARVHALVGDARARCGMTARILRHPTLVRVGLSAARIWPSLAARVAESIGSSSAGSDACRT